MTELTTQCYTEYSHNNSGGRWWLTDEDWQALEVAGWVVEWAKDRESKYLKPDAQGRYMGTLATSATRHTLSLGEAITEWERVTHQDSSALGCNCCGTPHHFTHYGADGKFVDSYSPETPYQGSRYDDPPL